MGDLGALGWHDFYMCTQNWLKLEIWYERILIHALELALGSFPMFVCICDVLCHGTTWWAWSCVHTHTHTHTRTWRSLPICTKLHYMQSGCIVRLCMLDCIIIGIESGCTSGYLKKYTVVDIKVTRVGGVYCEGDAGYFLLRLWFFRKTIKCYLKHPSSSANITEYFSCLSCSRLWSNDSFRVTFKTFIKFLPIRCPSPPINSDSCWS